jgi:hypothetical protein
MTSDKSVLFDGFNLPYLSPRQESEYSREICVVSFAIIYHLRKLIAPGVRSASSMQYSWEGSKYFALNGIVTRRYAC